MCKVNKSFTSFSGRQATEWMGIILPYSINILLEYACICIGLVADTTQLSIVGNSGVKNTKAPKFNLKKTRLDLDLKYNL